MSHKDKNSQKKSVDFTYPVSAARKFIYLFNETRRPNEEQRAMLAAAYYTLAMQKNVSRSRSKMHVNSAIALLKNINVKARMPNWGSQIAHAYFKRAELLEEKDAFSSATLDYQQAIQVLENERIGSIIDDEDRLLLAQSSISIADLIVNEQIDEKEKDKLSHPLFYINKALEHLADINEIDDDIWATLAYAHQIAGIALSHHHFEESKEAFRVALFMAFKTETVRICPLLADIYTCLGLLYEHSYQSCPIQKVSNNLLDHAMIYFGLSLIFSVNEANQKEDDMLVLESLFEMIYRVLDPYLSPVSFRVTYDLVDALIYAYMCLNDKALPNEILAHQLNQPDALDTYAQHIYWLIIEAYRQENKDAGLLEIADPNEVDYELELSDILNIIQTNRSNNVHYLDKPT